MLEVNEFVKYLDSYHSIHRESKQRQLPFVHEELLNHWHRIQGLLTYRVPEGGYYRDKSYDQTYAYFRKRLMDVQRIMKESSAVSFEGIPSHPIRYPDTVDVVLWETKVLSLLLKTDPLHLLSKYSHAMTVMRALAETSSQEQQTRTCLSWKWKVLSSYCQYQCLAKHTSSGFYKVDNIEDYLMTFWGERAKEASEVLERILWPCLQAIAVQGQPLKDVNDVCGLFEEAVPHTMLRFVLHAWRRMSISTYYFQQQHHSCGKSYEPDDNDDDAFVERIKCYGHDLQTWWTKDNENRYSKSIQQSNGDQWMVKMIDAFMKRETERQREKE